MKMKNTHNVPGRQTGLSLVEMLIAMLISLILMAGVYQTYLGSKQAYRTQDGLSRIQENARFALDFLTKDIRMADVWGCVPNSIDTNLQQVVTSIDGFGYDPTAAASANTSGIFGTEGGAGASDSISIQGVGGPSGVWSVPVTPSVGNIVNLSVAPPAGALAPGDNVVVSNCGTGNIATVQNIAGTVVTLGGTMTQPFGNGALLYPVHTVTYTIQNGANGRPALFRAENGAAAVEVVPNVVQMQIQYNDGRGAYVNADAVPPIIWSAVDSVRISLTLETPNDNIATANSTYTVVDNAGAVTPVVAGDRRLYRTFSTVIDLRGN